jgi:hypothetical protein
VSGKSSGAPNATVHLEHAKKKLIVFNVYHYGKFKSASGISSGAPNVAVQLEHATIFI